MTFHFPFLIWCSYIFCQSSRRRHGNRVTAATAGDDDGGDGEPVEGLELKPRIDVLNKSPSERSLANEHLRWREATGGSRGCVRAGTRRVSMRKHVWCPAGRRFHSQQPRHVSGLNDSTHSFIHKDLIYLYHTQQPRQKILIITVH